MNWLKKYDLLEEKDEIIIRNVEEEVLDKGGKVYLLKHKEEIVGSVGLIPKSSDSIEIVKLAVDKKHIGLGLGQN